MKKIITLVLLAGLAVSGVSAQETAQRKWHFEMDLRYQHMFLQSWYDHSESHYYDETAKSYVDEKYSHESHTFLTDDDFPHKYGGNTLVLMETYDVSHKLTLGFGLEIARYNQADLSGMNIMASLRFKPWSRHSNDYLYTEAGLGPMVDLGWGSSAKLSKRRRLDFKIGYDLQVSRSKTASSYVQEDGEYAQFSGRTTKLVHCLQASIGIVF